MIDVSCAIIIQQDKILCVQRGTGRHLAGKWEFPGGKVHDRELPEDSVVREVREELDIAVEVQDQLSAVVHAYPDKTVRLFPFLCRIAAGTLHLREHRSFQWLGIDELDRLDWCEADQPVIQALKKKSR